LDGKSEPSVIAVKPNKDSALFQVLSEMIAWLITRLRADQEVAVKIYLPVPFVK
jgi:hypothetical protein